jgi:hypothetical protein
MRLGGADFAALRSRQLEIILTTGLGTRSKVLSIKKKPESGIEKP